MLSSQRGTLYTLTGVISILCGILLFWTGVLVVVLLNDGHSLVTAASAIHRAPDAPAILHDVFWSVVVAGFMAVWASFFAVRLTSFHETRRRALLVLTDPFSGVNRLPLSDTREIRNELVRRFGSLSAELRSQDQNQAGEDLAQISDQMCELLDKLNAEPLPPKYEDQVRRGRPLLAARLDVLWQTWRFYEPDWIQQIMSIKPDVFELAKFAGVRLWPKRPVRVGKGQLRAPTYPVRLL